MIRGRLRNLHSPDLKDLQSPALENPEDFSVLLQAFIGPEGAEGYESFDFLICTPRSLGSEVARQGVILGRHRLIVESYSYSHIWRAIDQLCQSTWGRDWNEVATKLGRHGLWEFEDYA